MNVLSASVWFFATLVGAFVLPTKLGSNPRNVSQALFNSLEELARIVDIAYCVGSTGIQKPFRCLSRCNDFPAFELITTWHTGPLLSDSCGYIALSHPPHPKRIIVAFRGTYSIANTVADLSTIPAEYVPFPADGGAGDDICATSIAEKDLMRPQSRGSAEAPSGPRCVDCRVHGGFMTSWKNTRCIIMPHVEQSLAAFPDYQLTLVGHSLGGAVAALAALEYQARGWKPQITTFGEPRVGNHALSSYIDDRFNLTKHDVSATQYRRVTHVRDPVPLLPLDEWGYRPHAGEIFISKYDLPPKETDLEHCDGDEDAECIAGPRASDLRLGEIWHLPDRYKLWELFFAHRDYFWRLGLCIPQPSDWWPPWSPLTAEDI